MDDPVTYPAEWYRQFLPEDHDAVLTLLSAAQEEGDVIALAEPGVYVSPDLYDRVLALWS